MNHIDALHIHIKKYFYAEKFEEGNTETFTSPSGKFRFEETQFWSNDPVWSLTRVHIYDEQSNEVLFDFFVDLGVFYFGWTIASHSEYLICSDTISCRQHIIDLENRNMASSIKGGDSFIWSDFYTSPDGKLLATIGCYWACQAILKIYDFSDPLNLPLREIGEFELLDNDETIVGWLDNQTLKMKGIKRETKPEYFSDYSFRMKIISEQPMEREITIYRT